MTFESLVIRFSNRLLTGRTFELIVAPALADLQYDDRGGTLRKRQPPPCSGLVATRDEIKRGLDVPGVDPCRPSMCLLTICLDFFSSSSASFAMTTGIVVISFAPVLVLFWPERRAARQD